MAVISVLSVDSELLRGFITWGGILIIKLLLMAFLTSIQRYKSGAMENPEDVVMRPGAELKKDENVERVRRAHLNDLENIPAFLITAFFYILSEPNVQVALWLIRVAVIARILHTIVYAVYPVRQPARGISFFVCLIITVFMIISSMVHFFQI